MQGRYRRMPGTFHIPPMVSETLIARCKAHDRKAQYELYRALYGMMMGICSRYERDRQEATARMNQGFLKILTQLDGRRAEVPFEAWARRIMINTVIDAFRKDKQRRAVEASGAILEEAGDPQMNEYLAHMEAEAFAALLIRVPTMSRNVFNLFAVDGHSHAEIAGMLGISEGTSKWHVAHARSILKQALSTLSQHNERTVAS